MSDQDQTDLFPDPEVQEEHETIDMPRYTRHRSEGPDTSVEAAYSIEDLPRAQRLVFGLFSRHGEMTDGEAQDWAKFEKLQISTSGLRARRSELVSIGAMRDTQKRRVTQYGRAAKVWSVTDEA